MKYIDFFFAPGVRPTSLIIGLFVGGIVSLFADWRLGVFVGAVIALAASFVIPTVVYLQERPYILIKKSLPQPFLFDEHVYFTVKNGSVGGHFVLTENSMVFLSLEKGNHRLELVREDVRTVKLGEDLSLCIYLDDTRFIRVLSACNEELFQVLGEQGWNAIHF